MRCRAGMISGAAVFILVIADVIRLFRQVVFLVTPDFIR